MTIRKLILYLQRHVRYSVEGLTVRSENAAKSPAEASRPLVNWLLKHVLADAALDYGCGRLRYSSHLARRSQRLALVDSDLQLDRPTYIGRRSTSVREHAKARWPACTVYSLDEFWLGVPDRYGFVLCANVLSAIPSRTIRSRSLNSIRQCLSSDGRLLVVNQHTNSYFSEASRRRGSRRHLDGWILPSKNAASYFGVLGKAKSIRILRAHGFRILDAWIEGQSNYVLAGKGQ